MLLVAGAFEPELAPAREVLAGADEVSFLETGIGSVRAAAVVTHALSGTKSSRVLFIGSCGAYKAFPPLLSLVAVSSILPVDYLNAAGKAHIPGPRPSPLFPDPRLFAIVAEAADQTCAAQSPLSIADDEAAAALLADFSEAAVENLELFGVATACSCLNIPWAALCAVTNRVGPGSAEAWTSNRERAAKLTARAVSALKLTT